MREILFRGKRIDNDEWIYGDLLHPTEDDNDYYIEDFTQKKNNCHPVIPKTICEYTGVKDKNRKRIFEADIISIPYEEDVSGFTEYQEALVFWDDERFGWRVKFMDGEILYLNDIVDLSLPRDVEVIGNIIDNKETLEAFLQNI